MDEGSKISRFNAGVAQAERIDVLQRAINMARFNPLVVDMNTQTYNYEVILNANDGLLLEAWAKLTEAEKKQADKIYNLAHGFKKTFPIIMQNNNGDQTINRQNFEKFMEILNTYEKKNKVFLDEHSLNSPNMDDDEGL